MNTHTRGAFDEAFQADEARRLVERIEFHYTPKHGSWLNIAENELSSLTRQCQKDRREANLQTPRAETTAWAAESNEKQRLIARHFTIDDAQEKLNPSNQTLNRDKALAKFDSSGHNKRPPTS